MKHIIFGGFDYAVLYEMNQNAILEGIDYFVETDETLIGTSYLGKPIKPLNALKEENLEEILILIGSIVYKTELELQLKELGLQENIHYMWAISFTGDDICPRLWKHIEWSDKEKNADNLKVMEQSEYCFQRLKVAASLVNWDDFDTVVDLGAGAERLEALLPERINYIPVDYVQFSERTVLCDLNKYEFPDKKYFSEKTCIFSISNIPYCSDWKWYLNQMAEHCDCIILEHPDFARISREYRRTHWNRNNALFDHEIIRYMQELNFILVDSVDFRLRDSIYKFERRRK